MKLRLIPLLIPALVLVILLNACKKQSNKAQPATSESCAPLNPNGDSELALIMRQMAKLAEENAAALRNGKDLTPYDGGFDKMLKAKRSMHIEEAFFQGSAKAYLTALNALYVAGPEDRVKLHNNLVNTCQNCHGETCRGPLKRIDKMIVSN